MQVDASLQNQNLCTDLRWVAKRIRKSSRKFTQVAKCRKFHAYAVDSRSAWMCRLALGDRTVKSLRRLGYEFELDQSHRKPTQVGGQMKPSWTQVENFIELLKPFIALQNLKHLWTWLWKGWDICFSVFLVISSLANWAFFLAEPGDPWVHLSVQVAAAVPW